MYKRCCDTGVLTKAGFNACKQAAKISKGFRGCTRSAVCAQQCVDALIPIMKEKCGASAPCEDVARFIKVRVWSVPAPGFQYVSDRGWDRTRRFFTKISCPAKRTVYVTNLKVGVATSNACLSLRCQSISVLHVLVVHVGQLQLPDPSPSPRVVGQLTLPKVPQHTAHFMLHTLLKIKTSERFRATSEPDVCSNTCTVIYIQGT